MTRMFFLATGFLALLTACGGNGTCAGSGSDILDICYEGWTAGECSEYDDNGTNGSQWDFYPSQSCEDLGYTRYCPEYDSWVYSNESC